MISHLLLTILIALFVMGIVIAGLAIGHLIMGKPRLKRGCGLAPKKGGDRKHEPSSTCSLCGHKKECEENHEPDT